MKLYDDPKTAYDEIVATLQPGQLFTQEGFDYEGNVPIRVETVFPNTPLFDANGANSYEVGQGTVSDCGSLAAIACISESKNVYTIEDLIYPTTLSPHGLYLASVGVGTQRKWIAFDSNIPTFPSTTPGKIGGPVGAKPFPQAPALWAALMEKAAATSSNRRYSGLTGFGGFSDWIPTVKITVNTFEDLKINIENGGFANFSYAQQYDALGNKITPPGIVYGHAHGIVNAVQVGDIKMLRIENPWGSGTDYISSIVGENCPFWTSHPELSDALNETKNVGGAYWLTWEELVTLKGGSDIACKIPLPWNKYPNTKFFDYVFDDSYAKAGYTTYPSLTTLRAFSDLKKDSISIKCTEPTNVYMVGNWAYDIVNETIASGKRHSRISVALSNDSASNTAIARYYGYHGEIATSIGLLQPNLEYFLYPHTIEEPTDRGLYRVMVFADKPFTLIRNGVTI